MKLNSEGFIKHLNQQQPAAVYLIEGNEPLLVQEALDGLHHALKNQGFLERFSFQVDAGFNIADLDQLTQNFSLFSEKKRIELQCGEKIPAEFAQWIVTYCEQIQAFADVCLIVRTAKLSSAERKAKWVTAIEKAGVVLTIYEVDLAEFPRWLDSRLFQFRIKLAPEARIALIEHTEGNLLAAMQLIKKLELIRKDQVISLTELSPLLSDGARYDLFDLSRHVLLGDLKRSLKILQHLMQESEPVLVLWVLAKELKTLLLVHTKKKTVPLPELYRSLQIWDKRQKEVEAGLRRLSVQKVADLLSACAGIDLAVKGLAEGDPWQMLKDLVVKMSMAH